ncbi:AbiH family protein [Mesoflavibacter sp.]|uniref:AbiH family protein n=1 Tax=Mesoflavibacter sp. TaxID=1930902 RepID=UPI00351569B4
MRKVLITGNGFDLNYNLPTSYSDFINILNFVEQNDKYEFNQIYSNVDKYENILRKYKSFKINVESINDLKILLKNNLWYIFFSSEYRIDTWIDFENKIERVLKILFTSSKSIRKEIFEKGSLTKKDSFYRNTIFNNNAEVIYVLKTFKIIEIHKSNKSLFILNEDFLISKYDSYIDIDLDKISKSLLLNLNNFKKIFNYYFKIFVFPFYDNLKLKDEYYFLKQFTHHFTFNYTPTFEKVTDFIDVKTNYLHGNIESERNNIVLGINEIVDDFVDKNYFIPFTKTYQKLNYQTDYLFLKEFQDIENDYMFFFWGHSLDRSDKKYINEVFDFIKKLESNYKKIVIIYHDENAKSKLLLNLFSIRGENDIEYMMKENYLVFVKSYTSQLNSLIIDY